MANLKDLRSKIASTKKTRAVTKAMKMVSAAKLRRCQDNIINARPYARRLLDVIERMALNHQVVHPFLNRADNLSDSKPRLLLVVVTSDRGLCGPFNNAICKYTEGFLKDNKDAFEIIDFMFIGRKGAEYFKRRGVIPKKSILNLARTINYHLANDISESILESYLNGEYSQVQVIYNEFKSALRQDVVDEKILPVDANLDTSVQAFSSDFIFEPPIEEILDSLLKKHFAIQTYRCLQESVASEHGARMNAMENATKNAGEVISKLSLEYNKARQAKITTELIEITSGVEAL